MGAARVSQPAPPPAAPTLLTREDVLRAGVGESSGPSRVRQTPTEMLARQLLLLREQADLCLMIVEDLLPERPAEGDAAATERKPVRRYFQEPHGGPATTTDPRTE